MLDCAVFVDIAGHAQRCEFAHFVGRCDRAAEHEDRQPALIELADGADQLNAAGVRQPQVEHDQIDPGQIGAHAHEQLGGALDGQGRMPGAEQRRRESRPARGGVVTMTVFAWGHGSRCHVKSYGHGTAAR
jgi:hypothetical protein